MALFNGSFIKLTLYLFFFFINIQVSANVYYVSSSLGNNQNNGLTPMSPFKSISQLNSMIFNPGDSILFKSGEIFNGLALNINSKKDFRQLDVIISEG